MRVVVDTNVLVSAILCGRNPRAVIQFIVDTSDYSWMVSSETLAEYKEVLTRTKFKLKGSSELLLISLSNQLSQDLMLAL